MNTISTNNNLSPNFDQQLQVFLDCGFVLNPGIGTFELEQWPRNREDFEKDPFRLLYMVLGQNINREPHTPFTNQCWQVNLECVDGGGVYVKIMENISRITNGGLVFENLRDHVDFKNRSAWVTFDCNGDSYKWDLKVDDDWADGEIFELAQGLAEKYQTKKNFTYFDPGGNIFVLGYETQKGLKTIREKTGLNIVWLQGTS